MTLTRSPSNRLIQRLARPLGVLSMAAALTAGLSACAPIMLGGAMAGGMLVALDRRTTATQLEDQAIETKAVSRVRELVGDRAHVNPTSYNRMLLLTGEVPTEQDKQAIEQAVARIDNVRSIVNELEVMPKSSLSSRSNDVILAGKVKATFVDARDLHANAVKVVTERGAVFLMGRVTEREAARAASLARSVNGVRRVVRVFELLTEEELARLQPSPEQPRQDTAPPSRQ